MKTIRVVNLKDFTVGLVLALAEREVLVIDKPEPALHAAIESAYEAIRGDIERERRKAWGHATIYEAIGDSALFGPAEIIEYALGARLMTCEPSGQALGLIYNECFTRAYFGFQPARGRLYRKAAEAFLDYPG